MATTLGRFEWRRKTATAWATSGEVLLDGEPGYESDTKRWKLGDGTTVWTALPYREAGIVVDAASPIFGSTRTQAQINAAIQYVKTAGGGLVRVRRADGPWAIGRNISSSQKDGGLLIDGSNITLDSDGAVLNLTNNSDFIAAKSTFGTQVTITADVTVTDTTLTVTSSASFTVGMDVFLRLGQAAYDPAEPDFWLWAKIAAIPDSTHVTLDRPTGYAFTVASVPTVSQRSIAPVTNLVENIGITGTWNMVNPMTGSANAEGGIRLYGVRNARIGTIIASNPGAAAVGAQFCDSLNIDTVRVPISVAQGGQASKGRGVEMAECRGVHIGVVDIENFEKNAILSEARTEGFTIDTVVVRNTNTARAAAGSVPLIAGLGNSKLDIGTLTVTGYGTNVWDVAGDPINGGGCVLNIGDAYFYTSTKNTIFDMGIIRRSLTIDGKTFTARRTYTKRFHLGPNVALTGNFPAGLLISGRVYCSNAAGFDGIYIGDGAGNVADVKSAAVTGQFNSHTQLRGYGSSYNPSRGMPKPYSIFTNAAGVAGAQLYIEVTYWADPATVFTGDTVIPDFVVV